MIMLRHFRTNELLTDVDGNVCVYSEVPEIYQRLVDCGLYVLELL